MNVKKPHQSEIIMYVFNDKSQGSTAKHLSYDGLLHYKYIISFAGKRIVKIGEFSKVAGKCLIVSYAPLALHVCPQRRRTRQICVLRTETIANSCYANRQINVSLLSTNIKLPYRPVLTY